jgi:ElaA protein
MTGLQWFCKSFAELDALTLYRILSLREAVFIVEQACAVMEADGADEAAFHVYAQDASGNIAAYLRFFPPGHVYHGAYAPEARIGRVVTRADQRGTGLGHKAMRVALDEMAARFGNIEIVLSAQTYIQEFYAKHGFVAEGAIYEEDTQPHVFMRKKGA